MRQDESYFEAEVRDLTLIRVYNLIKPALPLPYSVIGEIITHSFNLGKAHTRKGINYLLRFIRPLFKPPMLYYDNENRLVKRYRVRSNNVKEGEMAALCIYFRRYYDYDQLRTVAHGVKQPVVLTFCTDMPNLVTKAVDSIPYEILYADKGQEAKVQQHLSYKDINVRSIVYARDREQYDYYCENLISGTMIAVKQKEVRYYSAPEYSITKIKRT